jgi:hypothetical protein
MPWKQLEEGSVDQFFGNNITEYKLASSIVERLLIGFDRWEA